MAKVYFTFVFKNGEGDFSKIRGKSCEVIVHRGDVKNFSKKSIITINSDNGQSVDLDIVSGESVTFIIRDLQLKCDLGTILNSKTNGSKVDCTFNFDSSIKR